MGNSDVYNLKLFKWQLLIHYRVMKSDQWVVTSHLFFNEKKYEKEQNGIE